MLKFYFTPYTVQQIKLFKINVEVEVLTIIAAQKNDG
jgi:hypothetical protein